MKYDSQCKMNDSVFGGCQKTDQQQKCDDWSWQVCASPLNDDLHRSYPEQNGNPLNHCAEHI